MSAPDGTPDPKAALLLRAALSGPFVPQALLRDVLSPEDFGKSTLRARLLSALREMCSVDRSGSGERWDMRQVPRQRVLEDYDVEASPTDAGTEVTRALSGEGEFAPETLGALAEAADDVEALSATVATLERAGAKARGHGHLIALRGRMTTMLEDARTDRVLLDDIEGSRIREAAVIEDWIDAPGSTPPLRTVHVEGLPGIGKSYLLERIVRLARARPEVILVRLDFDRSALQVGEGGSILHEVSRQIGDALPREAERLRDLRLQASERATRGAYGMGAYGRGAYGRGETASPRELLDAMVDLVAGAGRRLVFLLDTLEALHSKGATFVHSLLDELDRFAESRRIDVTLISAGRGHIFPPGHPRLRDLLPLEGLDEEVSRAMLRQNGVPEEAWGDIVSQARGNPLRLKLFSQGIADAGNGYLYRAIGSRLPEPLSTVASLGLIMPDLTAETLDTVVLPALDLPVEAGGAESMLLDLRAQDWLVLPAAAGTGVAQRPEIRDALLDDVYRDSPKEAAAINARAAVFFQESDPLRSLYHALQSTRSGAPLPPIEASLAQRLPDALLRELPLPAQDAVRHARGERSTVSALRQEETGAGTERAYDVVAARSSGLRRRSGAGAAGGPSRLRAVSIDPASRTERARLDEEPGSMEADPRAVQDLRLMLEDGELREASHIVRQGLSGRYDPRGEPGLLLLCHQWLTGRWSIAGRLFDLLDETDIRARMEAAPRLEGRVLLDMWAEFRFSALVDLLGQDSFRSQALAIRSLAPRTGMVGGALDFALLAASGFEPGIADEGASALAPSLCAPRPEPAMARLHRAEAMRQDMGLLLTFDGLGDPASMEPARFAVAVAPTNPYAAPILALIGQYQAAGAGRVIEDLFDLADALPAAAALFVPEIGDVARARARTGAKPADILGTVCGMGLLADWAEGYGFFHPIPDLRPLARAAGRWRDATAGRWTYASPPPRPAPPEDPEAPDAVTTARADRLMALDIDDGGETVDRMLRFWSDPQDRHPAAGLRMIHHRLGRFLTLSPAPPLGRFLLRLLEAGVPATLVPPLAVSAARSRSRSR